MTKEAKLSAAMRIVPEWSKYDDEIKALQARVRRGLYQASDHEQEIETPVLEETTSDNRRSEHDDHTEL